MPVRNVSAGAIPRADFGLPRFLPESGLVSGRSLADMESRNHDHGGKMTMLLTHATRIPSGVFVLAAGFIATGCGSAHDPNAFRELPVDELVEDHSISVPDGSPEELFAFMERVQKGEFLALENERISATTGKHRDTVIRVMEARITACDKVLAQETDQETKYRATLNRLAALRILAPLQTGRAEQFDAEVDELTMDQDLRLREIGLAVKFQADVCEFLTDANADSWQLSARLEQLLAEPQAGKRTLMAARDAGHWILQSGDMELAATVYRRTGQRFATHSDGEVAAEASRLSATAINVELTALVRRVDEQQPQAVDQLMAKIVERLDTVDKDPTALEFAMRTAQYLEFSARYDLAREAYGRILDAFSEDPMNSTVVRTSVEYANRRMDLVGQSVLIDGNLIDGRPFPWEALRDKWVLVTFWTSWHPDWPAEYQSIRRHLAGDEAVEVVLVNLDDDRNLVERYLQEHPTSFTMVFNSDADVPGFSSGNAVRCGVEAVPFSLLVDPQGVVVDIHLMGDRLPDAIGQWVHGTQ